MNAGRSSEEGQIEHCRAGTISCRGKLPWRGCTSVLISRTNAASAPSFEEPFEPPFDADVVVDTNGVLSWRCSGENQKCRPRSHGTPKLPQAGDRSAARDPTGGAARNTVCRISHRDARDHFEGRLPRPHCGAIVNADTVGSWHVCDMPTSSSDVRSQGVAQKTFAQTEFF